MRRLHATFEFLGFFMNALVKPLLAALFVLSLAACAAQQPQIDIQPPPRKPLDAKTQLETGKKY